MFRMPKLAMVRRLSSSAPAPIESMAITAPTPKIMPSMVKKDRNLCLPRLARAPIIVSIDIIGTSLVQKCAYLVTAKRAVCRNTRPGAATAAARRGPPPASRRPEAYPEACPEACPAAPPC